ncbi:unknown [Eggerthella sp. CAG:1427]|nr:unknown [Eggerthella sp. CAG:1427]
MIARYSLSELLTTCMEVKSEYLTFLFPLCCKSSLTLFPDCRIPRLPFHQFLLAVLVDCDCRCCLASSTALKSDEIFISATLTRHSWPMLTYSLTASISFCARSCRCPITVSLLVPLSLVSPWLRKRFTASKSVGSIVPISPLPVA